MGVKGVALFGIVFVVINHMLVANDRDMVTSEEPFGAASYKCSVIEYHGIQYYSDGCINMVNDYEKKYKNI